MEIFTHKKLKYKFISTVRLPNGDESIYSSIERISLSSKWNGKVKCVLEGSTNEMLNDRELVYFDKIMLQIGKIIYPIEFEMSDRGNSHRMMNYNDVIHRWETCIPSIITEYSNAELLVKYIDTCTPSIQSEDLLLNSIKQNIFIQLFFLDKFNDSVQVTIYNFPKGQEKHELLFHKDNECNGGYSFLTKYYYDDMNRAGKLQCQYSNDGLPVCISLVYTIENPKEGMYTKKVLIDLIN